MDITNKTRRPIRVPLPSGKKLFLGPGKTGQITPKAAAHPPLLQLVEAGDLELDDTGRKTGVATAETTGGKAASQGGGGASNIRRTGDR